MKHEMFTQAHKELHKKGLRVEVKSNNVDAALRTLKRRLMQEGIVKDMRKHEFYESPSERRRKEHAEAVMRNRKRISEQRKLEG